MKQGAATINKTSIGSVDIRGGYLGHLSLTQAPDGPEPSSSGSYLDSNGNAYLDANSNAYFS